MFRGYLVQAAALWTRNLWLPGLVTSLLFAAAHGAQDPWLFADRFAFGLIAWWLTIRTGGLEGAIAIHVVHNLGGLIFAAAVDDIDAALTVTDINPLVAVIDIALTLLIAALIARYAKRSQMQTASVPAGSDPAQGRPDT